MIADALASYVRPGGKIVLSGILDSQIEEMSELLWKMVYYVNLSS